MRQTLNRTEPPKAPLILIAIGVAALALAGGLSSSPWLASCFIVISGAAFLAGVGLWLGPRLKRRDPYDLASLRDVHAREELRELEEALPEVEFDSVVCPHCGTVYKQRMPVCPACRH